jgi:uncharacterized DUF497 family protein
MTLTSIDPLVLPSVPWRSNETLWVNWSAHADTQQQVAAARRWLRAGQRQRYSCKVFRMFKFEWDGQKAASNLSKHGVSFDEAVSVFGNGRALTFSDTDHSEFEDRSRTYGIFNKSRLMVVATPARWVIWAGLAYDFFHFLQRPLVWRNDGRCCVQRPKPRLHQCHGDGWSAGSPLPRRRPKPSVDGVKRVGNQVGDDRDGQPNPFVAVPNPGPARPSKRYGRIPQDFFEIHWAAAPTATGPRPQRT